MALLLRRSVIKTYYRAKERPNHRDNQLLNSVMRAIHLFPSALVWRKDDPKCIWKWPIYRVQNVSRIWLQCGVYVLKKSINGYTWKLYSLCGFTGLDFPWDFFWRFDHILAYKTDRKRTNIQIMIKLLLESFNMLFLWIQCEESCHSPMPKSFCIFKARREYREKKRTTIRRIKTH